LKKISQIAIVLLLGSLAALGQQSRVYREGGNWVEELTGSIASARNLQLDTERGAVRVQGGPQANITYTIRKRVSADSEQSARRQFDAFRVDVAHTGDAATFQAEWAGGKHAKLSADFTLQVPRELQLAKVATNGGSIAIQDIAGRVDASSGGGSLKLDRIGGSIKGETGGGSIEVGEAGGDVNLETGGGSIRIGAGKGKITAQTGGGNVVVMDGSQGAVLETGGGGIQVKRCQGSVRASTGGGGIELGMIDGPAELETGGGSIRLGGAKGIVRAESGGGSIELLRLAQCARAETGGGAITAEFVAPRGSFRDSVLETPSGDITVYLAPDMQVTVRAYVDLGNGHRIDSQFAELRPTTEGGEYGPSRIMLEGNLNGGGPVLKAHTTSGDISFLRSTH
jgi:hypothetical protein